MNPELVTDLHEAIADAQRQMDEDIDHPAYCVVRNGDVQALIKAAEAVTVAIANDARPPETHCGGTLTAAMRVKTESHQQPTWWVLYEDVRGTQPFVVWRMSFNPETGWTGDFGHYHASRTKALATLAIKTRLWYPGIDLTEYANTGD